jgi:hypothetical protein
LWNDERLERSFAIIASIALVAVDEGAQRG